MFGDGPACPRCLVGEGLELWQAAALGAGSDAQGRRVEAEQGVAAAEQPGPPDDAPVGSEGAQGASEPPGAKWSTQRASGDEPALPALDVDTLARRAHEREREARLKELCRRNAERWWQRTATVTISVVGQFD